MAYDLEPLKTFRYLPTEHVRDIRLVIIYPGVEEEIKCSLTPWSLDDQPRFIALSYVWGDPALVEEVICDNATLPVTKNLKTAMRSLRHATEGRTFWIDAICINQKDTEERNRHVRSMREIYSSAQEVLIWLGPESADSPIAFELMDMLARSLREGEHLFPSSDADEGRPFWEAYASICGRPWFRRVWVRQEVAVAKKAILMCGTQLKEWQTLVDAFREVSALGLDRYNADLGPCEQGYGIINLRQRFQSDRGIELQDLLAGQELESSDSRDKVYALVGLVMTPAAQAVKFDVNYSKPIPEVFTDLARFAIEAYKSVQVLGHVREESENAPRFKDLPSWVPDLSSPAPGPVLYNPGSHYKDFCAAGAAEAIFRNIVNEPQAIAVKGYAMDTVKSLGNMLKTPVTVFSDDHAKCAVLRNWEDIVAEQAPYVTGEAISEAYTWTIVADANMPQNGAYMYGCWASSVVGAEPSSYRNSEHDDSASGVSANVLSKALQEACETVKSDPDAVRLRDQGAREINQDWGSYSMLYLVGMMDAAFDRRLFATDKGYIGLAPAGTQVGDRVCILLGGHTPFLLRPSEQYSGRYRLVGECYVHGIMHGEALQQDGLDLQEFILR
jgi:hypothetical protein